MTGVCIRESMSTHSNMSDTIDSKTKVNLFATLGLLGMAVTATVKIVTIDYRLASIGQKLADPWTVERMSSYMRIFEVSNKVKYPDLVVPEVK